MFNEKIALKMRLEQLEDTEIRILKELREERQYIFKRLREIDEKESVLSTTNNIIDTDSPLLINSNSNHENNNILVNSREHKTRRSRPSRRSKTSKLCEIAIHILKEQNEPIRGTELQRKIEETTGLKIANMTTFMKAVEKADRHIQKPQRGLYMYVV